MRQQNAKFARSAAGCVAVHHWMRHAGARKFCNIRKTRNTRAIRFEMSSSAVPPGCIHVPKNKESFYRRAPSECWTCLFLIWRVPLVSAASLQWHVLCTQSNCGALATHRDRKRPPLHAETRAPVWCCCWSSLYHLFLSRVPVTHKAHADVTQRFITFLLSPASNFPWMHPSVDALRRSLAQKRL